MKDNCILIIDLHTIQTDRQASLCCDRTIGGTGVMHNKGYMLECCRKGMIGNHSVKCMDIGTDVFHFQWNSVHIDRVNQVPWIG